MGPRGDGSAAESLLALSALGAGEAVAEAAICTGEGAVAVAGVAGARCWAGAGVAFLAAGVGRAELRGARGGRWALWRGVSTATRSARLAERGAGAGEERSASASELVSCLVTDMGAALALSASGSGESAPDTVQLTRL
jgi:hypothetical protein